MHKLPKLIIWLLAFFVASSAFIQKGYCNIHAIDFSKVHYPAQLQDKIDFLKNNEQLYDHWFPNWSSSIPKTDVVAQLKAIYSGLDNVTAKTIETWLLLGDVAHYLYNLDEQDYYDKAVTNYQQARSLAPNDYRGYWFVAHHYSLAAEPVLAIEAFQQAVQILPAHPSFLFWNDYAGACMLAGMYGTARYVAHQASIMQGFTSPIEAEIIKISGKSMRPPPVDTTLSDKEVWNLLGKSGRNLTVNSWVMGTQFAVDSTWNLQLGGYSKHLTYAVVIPDKITSKKGVEIGFSFLVMAKVADENESLQQFLDNFTQKSADRKPITLPFSKTNNGLAYETKDPSIYSNIGGAHGYAIAVERDMPEFPGLKLDKPSSPPKGEPGKVHYFVAQQKEGRIKAKLFYLIIFDSCEDIHDESLKVFDNFLRNVIFE
jgi:tetratricopeptide (TPR) repeat protein